MREVTEFARTFRITNGGNTIIKIVPYLKIVWECDTEGCDNRGMYEVPVSMGIKPTDGSDPFLCISCWLEVLDGCTKS